MAVRNISEAVYVGMCLEIGTPQQVTYRRETTDIEEMLDWNTSLKNRIRVLISGSIKEGFRLFASDVDFLRWPNDHRVIWDFSQSQLYDTQGHALILCDSSESPPGFTLLWLPLERADNNVLTACVQMKRGLYISSLKYREIICSLSGIDCTIHGPCTKRLFLGEIEYEHAHCFVSDFWSPSASSWIDRCHSWPPPHIVNDIVRNGCHVVAIGHKLGNHADNEWRISFSQAEQKLVYSMNHTQFLTYGLLKILLKEVINNGLREDEKLLCSYHIKTAVFWVIQHNIIPFWCPLNLLAGFWVCFKLLLKWVFEGVCPNFFIPENNMFLSNVFGEAQTKLFTQLYRLYEKGITLLLHSPSIGSYISNFVCNPRLVIFSDEHTLIAEAKFDRTFFMETSFCLITNFDIEYTLKYLYTVEQMIGPPLTQYQIFTLEKCTATILRCMAFILKNMYNTTRSNKQVYIVDKISCHMLKLAARFGFVSDMLYIAMYYYKTFRYMKALSVIDETKKKLSRPYVMYNGHVDRWMYNEAVGGLSLSTKMRQAVAQNIILYNKIFYINDLMPEQQSSKQNLKLPIPPFAVLYMLEVLCSRHVDTMRTQRSLDDLQVLVHYDQGQLIPVEHRDISWEILGICQQITGNLQAALYSYQQSLRQEPSHKIQTATRQRIQYLHL